MDAETTCQEILADLSQNACPADAEPMARYMRNQFPFFGIKAPLRKKLIKARAGKASDWDELLRLVERLYAAPQREAHYAALDVLEASSKTWPPEVLDLLERLTLTQPWWDTVDRIASPLAWKAFSKFPQELKRTDAWIRHDSFWLQRVALIYQLKAKNKTDRDKLARYIEVTMDSREFFLRKAIGWALRQYSYTDPHWVRAFVESHRECLSALSIREATRAL